MSENFDHMTEKQQGDVCDDITQLIKDNLPPGANFTLILTGDNIAACNYASTIPDLFAQHTILEVTLNACQQMIVRENMGTLLDDSDPVPANPGTKPSDN